MPQRRRHRLLRIVASVLVVLVLAAVAGAVAVQNANLWHFSAVTDDAMRPSLSHGDLALLRPEQPTALQPGQVVALSVDGSSVLHRVVDVGVDGGAVTIRTKADASASADPGRTAMPGPTVWVVATHVPDLGYVLIGAHSRRVLLAASGALILLFVVLVVRRLWRPHAPGVAVDPARAPAPAGADFSAYWWRYLDPPRPQGVGASPQFAQQWLSQLERATPPSSAAVPGPPGTGGYASVA